MSHKSTVDRADKGQSLLVALDSYVAIDVETTGIVPAMDEIIEFGAVRVEHGAVVDTFSSLANPGREIPHLIEIKTGITNAMVAEARPVADVLFDFLHFIGDRPLVGHNVGFDVNFIYDSALRHYGHGIDNDHVDTARLARRAMPYLPNHKLGTIAKRCQIPNPQAHRALSDAQCAQRLYERLKGCILYDKVLPESCAFGGYTYEAVYDSIQRMIGYDEDDVSLKVTKNGASIYMFGGVGFTVRINSRTRCLDTKVSAARDYIDQIDGASCSDDTVHIPIASAPESCEAIKALVQAVYESRRSSLTSGIACCSDFILCSDRRECTKKGDPYYSGCLYRKNLEAGRIFYGVNKNC